jgi:hypothetical protein
MWQLARERAIGVEAAKRAMEAAEKRIIAFDAQAEAFAQIRSSLSEIHGFMLARAQGR